MRGTVFVEGATRPVPVTITVAPDRVEAVADEGERWSIPLAEASVHPGGFDGDHVFVRTGDEAITIATNAPELVPALEAVADARLMALIAKVGLHRRAHSRMRAFGIGAVVGVGILIALGIAGLVFWAPGALADSVDALPIDVDRQLGDAAEGELASGPRRDDPVLLGFVRQVVDRLAPEAATPGFDFRVEVVESSEPNAFALPGGRIVVYTGLLEAAGDPEEVAGVLAHEMAHVTLRHGMRNVAHRAGLWLAASILLGDGSDWVRLAGDAAVVAQSNGYSREQEAAADAEGARMMAAAGLDPAALARFLERLMEAPGADLEGAMSWLSTHPDTASRIADVESLARTLPRGPRRPLEVDWAAVRSAAR